MEFPAWDPLVRALVTGLSGGGAVALVGKIVDRWMARAEKRTEELSAFRQEQRAEIALLKRESEDKDVTINRLQGEKLSEMKLRVQAEAQLELLRVRLQQAEIRGEDPSRPGWHHELSREGPKREPDAGAAGEGEDY